MAVEIIRQKLKSVCVLPHFDVVSINMVATCNFLSLEDCALQFSISLIFLLLSRIHAFRGIFTGGTFVAKKDLASLI
jgi:hypothetical protein